MRSALICVFITLVVQRDGSSTASAEHEEDFNPTPIPLSDWPRDRQEPAGTLQEIIKTEAPPAEAAVPAHYWEDALRHSVYLTLVRDKIDQLIAKGDYISPDSKPENLEAKENDDHDLWDKIKTARFDRLKEEPIPPADVTILARGRLLEDEQGYRFIEDDASQTTCIDSLCAKGVKALWSIKRMRQRETSPGKYHYELTFSVISQTPKKVKKPYENPVRTFTIKETIPTNERQRANLRGIIYQDRPQRAIWVHRNINPIPSYQKRPAPNSRGLDRIFSSLFSDDDSYEETYRHKLKAYMPNVYLPHSKVAHVDDREPYYQKKLLPYPVAKPQPHRYSHPPIVAPPAAYVQHPYFNVDSLGNLPPYVQPYSDNRFLPSNVIKTTRPAVLPTPITNYPLLKESTIEVPVKTRLNATESTTKEPDVTTYKMYHHQKQSPMKISYMTDHIRPPVYNAPPGIFVTMDKKPFKPMPPLKYSHLNNPQKSALPNFRPSPQVLDTQFSEQDSSADTAFRPITMNFTEISDFRDDDIISKKSNKNGRKPSAAKKPAKKHEHIKSTRPTTVTPEIITAESLTTQDGDDDEIEWANILGAFTKTTPMASHKEQSKIENIDPITSTTPLPTTTKEDYFESQDFTDSYEEEIPSTSSSTTTTTTTTPRPKKRTRPPPKFNKPEKIKKHKRVTSTTTTTLKPTRKYPLKKQTDDLTPQASSAATSATSSIWETKTHRAPASTTASTTTSSTTPGPTTTIKHTTTSTSSTTTTSSPTVDTEQPVVTTQPKSKNRFRQSTLMQKGTSVNHDKWSTSTLDKIRTNTATSNVYALRRKASKFTGYIPASTPRSPEVERDREDHRDHAYNFNKESISSSTTEKVEEDILVKILQPTLPTYEEQEMSYEPPTEQDDELEQEERRETEPEYKGTSMDVQETKDDDEYIFPTASVIQEVKEYVGLDDQAATTELTVVATPKSGTKNKTKCKKKKHNNLTTEKAFKSSTEPEATDTSETSSTNWTTASPSTPDIFNELFGGFTMDDTTEKPAREHPTPAPEQNSSESENHEHYLHLDDDLEDFLHSLDKKSNAHDDKSDEEYDDESKEVGSPFNIHEDSKQFKEDYYEDENDEDAQDAEESQDQPFSLLELMDME